MANWLRNYLLIQHSPMVIFTDFCSYLSTVVTNGNELIPDIVKDLQMHKAHIIQFSSSNVKRQPY